MTSWAERGAPPAPTAPEPLFPILHIIKTDLAQDI
jgi:hypothetical protein